MAGSLRESLVGPSGYVSQGPAWVDPGALADCVACDTLVDLASVCGAVSEFLYLLSGRRFKQKRAVIRPARRVSGCWSISHVGGWGWAPGGWTYEDDGLVLSGPVQQVMAVKVDGVELDPGDWVMADQRTLYRREGCWPDDQDVSVADDQLGTFTVDYVFGQTIPYGGKVAAKAWACYLANQLAVLASEGDCQLPSNVVSLSRQGVTLDRMSPYDFLNDGRIGIDLVDQWISVVNPDGKRKRATITSPDTIRGVQV